MAQLFIKCIFYIAPALQNKRKRYTKSAFNLQFHALFWKIDWRCGVYMKRTWKKNNNKIYMQENEQFKRFYICMSCSTNVHSIHCTRQKKCPNWWLSYSCFIALGCKSFVLNCCCYCCRLFLELYTFAKLLAINFSYS